MSKWKIVSGICVLILMILLLSQNAESFFDVRNLQNLDSSANDKDLSLKIPAAKSCIKLITYESISSTKASNSMAPLKIPTYNSKNCNSAIHPDIVDFGNGSFWNGYRFWMAMTPYPQSDNRYENPSIVASNNGTTWVEPSGIQNPIDTAQSTNYNSDTELLYEPKMDRLICYWRNVNGTNTTAYYSYSEDGINWTSRSLCYNGPCLSPSVIRISQYYFQIYVVYNGTFRRYTSNHPMASIWNDTNFVICNMSLLPIKSGVWHAKIRYDISHQMYIAVFMTVKRGTTNPDGPLYLAYSKDGGNFTVQNRPTLMERNPSGWDRDFIYRSTFWYNGNTLRIWYSARGGGYKGSWGIGFTTSIITWNSSIIDVSTVDCSVKNSNTTPPRNVEKNIGSNFHFNNDLEYTKLLSWNNVNYYGSIRNESPPSPGHFHEKGYPIRDLFVNNTTNNTGLFMNLDDENKLIDDCYISNATRNLVFTSKRLIMSKSNDPLEEKRAEERTFLKMDVQGKK